MFRYTSDLPQVRRLTFFLILSVSVNALLIAAMLYGFGGGFLISNPEGGRLLNIQHIPLADGRTQQEVIETLVHMLPEQLVAKLGDSQLVEGTFSHRDLALGCLVTLHHLDLSRALHGYGLPRPHRIELSDNQFLTVYPGLTERQYTQITAFINHERWPLTPEGLFLALKHPALNQDSTLAEAFYLTPQFLTLQRLFSRLDASVDRSELLEMLLQGDWSTIDHFHQAALQVTESSPALRRRMLLTYLQNGSTKAPQLILKSDSSYVKYMDDETILAVLNQAECVTPELETFVAEVVRFSHSEKVLQAAQKICSKALVSMVKEVQAHQVPVEKVYVVQKGDSLWKISKETKVPIDTLKAFNKLQTDVLRPGATLRIP